jgi:NADH-ubiquinone oxidoreductase chain 4L
MNLILICYIIIYCSGIMSLCFTRKHIILSLLRIEFIILRLFCIFTFFSTKIFSESYMLLIFLAFRVCEGVVGLSTLVSIIRSHGNDYLTSINIITC